MERKVKLLSLITTDIILINLGYILALYLRFEGNIDQQYVQVYIDSLIMLTVIKIIVFRFFKLYKSLWRYASIDELLQVVIAAIVANVAVLSYLFFLHRNFPRSIYILTMILDIMFIGGSRFSYRALRRFKRFEIARATKDKRVMIIGAGDAGAMIIKTLINSHDNNYKPVAIIDDDVSKEGRSINHVPVLGQSIDIVSVAKKQMIDEIIIALPSASKKELRKIVEECERTKCKLKIVPSMDELLDGKININDIREVRIEDLLGRDPVKLNMQGINDYITDKKVLVTGGGGSIGSELCRQIAKFKPSELIILDIYENNVYDLQNELKRKYNQQSKRGPLNLKVIIASVRDKDRIDEIMGTYRPDVVFHAAAHKHVPLMEDNPKEAVKNNTFGTLNVAQAANKYGVKRFVMISTDKAVNPTNIMGATKRQCEMIVQSINEVSETEFVIVRFGNVLGSNGSVIPLFKKQIAEGGPVTVTHKDVIRYFMTIPEASMLVLQAGAMAQGGEIFVLDMGEPVKIIDLARDLIKLSGFEPDKDIEIKITGLRPGEKLYEELLMDEEGLESTKHEKIFIGQHIDIDYEIMTKRLNNLKNIVDNETDEDVVEYVQEMVPTYKRDNHQVNAKFQQELRKEEVAVAKEEVLA